MFVVEKYVASKEKKKYFSVASNNLIKLSISALDMLNRTLKEVDPLDDESYEPIYRAALSMESAVFNLKKAAQDMKAGGLIDTNR